MKKKKKKFLASSHTLSTSLAQSMTMWLLREVKYQRYTHPSSISFVICDKSENREQLAAAGVLDSLSLSAKMPIPPKNRPSLHRSSSSVAHSSPPSPSPHGHSHMNGFLPPLHDRFGTSPMGSRSVGPASSKYFGTSSPSAYHRNSPPQGFSHSYSYQNESGSLPNHHHNGNGHRAYSSEHQIKDSSEHIHHQHQRSDPGYQHEMSSSLPSHFHMSPAPSRPVRWEPNGNQTPRSPSPGSEMDTTMSSSLPSLATAPSSHAPAMSYSYHHRQHHSQDFGRAPPSSNGHYGYEQGQTRGYGYGHGHSANLSSGGERGVERGVERGERAHHHSHSSSFSRSSPSGSPGPFSQSFPNYPPHGHHPSSPSTQSPSHHYSSSPSTSYYGSTPSYYQQTNGGSMLEDRRFHSAPIPVRR